MLGSTTAPHLTGQLLASNIHINGTEWKVVRTNVDLSPSYARLQHADLEPLYRGRITFDASAGLTKWSFTKSSSVQVDLDASQSDIADLVKLAGQQIPATGTLAANVKLHGTQLNLIGEGNVSLANLVAYDQPFQFAKVTFSDNGDEVHGNLAVQLPAGDLQGKVSVRPQHRTYTVQLAAAGIRLDRRHPLKERTH